MTRPNYELKASVLKTDFTSKQKEHSFLYHKLFGPDSTVLDSYDDESLRMQTRFFELDSYLNSNMVYHKEAKKINNANYHRTQRLEDRIARMVLDNEKALFLTFTFNDSTLERTNSQTRRKYVSRWLKNHALQYVANVDFGSKNDREHYHAVCVVDKKIPLQSWYDKGLGTLKSETVRKTSNNKQLARYISKLTNHAIKETNKRCVLIYSRNTLGLA